LRRSGDISAKRSEVLSAAEKLSICRRAESAAFSRLLDKKPLAAAQARPAAGHASKPITPRVAGQGARNAPVNLGGTAPATRGANGLAKSGVRALKRTGVDKFQAADRAILDYQYVKLPGTEVLVRGPLPADLSGGFVACLGGAHTLGRFIEHPYPALLQQQLGVPVLNLGNGGGKPEFYLQSSGLLEVVNRAKCVVIQVMSALGSPNRLLQPTSMTHNAVRIADGIPTPKNPVSGDSAYRILIKHVTPEILHEVVGETRGNWLAQMGTLLDGITVPKVLFWYSVRTPAYTEKFDNSDALLGDYPQLVTDTMITELRPKAQGYVECISSAGMPYELREATSQEPAAVFPWQADPAVNHYYPSAEMHTSAAEQLAPAVQGLMQ
jgi:hypothetical protein